MIELTSTAVGIVLINHRLIAWMYPSKDNTTHIVFSNTTGQAVAVMESTATIIEKIAVQTKTERTTLERKETNGNA